MQQCYTGLSFFDLLQHSLISRLLLVVQLDGFGTGLIRFFRNAVLFLLPKFYQPQLRQTAQRLPAHTGEVAQLMHRCFAISGKERHCIVLARCRFFALLRLRQCFLRTDSKRSKLHYFVVNSSIFGYFRM